MMLSLNVNLIGQTKKLSEAEKFQKEYNRRIKKSRINGVYIPKDLTDAIVELKAKSDLKGLNAFKNAEEVEVCKKLHFGLGKWIMVNWGLEGGSRYGHSLKDFGLSYPEDMTQFTMRALHKHMNKLNFDPQNLANEFIEIRKKEHEARLKKNTISETKRILTKEEVSKKK